MGNLNLNYYADRLPILAYTKVGKLVMITDKDDNPDYPFNSEDDSYAEDGTAATSADLAYVLEDVVIPKFFPPLTIHPGRKYRTRSGETVEILTTQGRRPYSVIGYVDNRSAPHTWTPEGGFCEGGN